LQYPRAVRDTRCFLQLLDIGGSLIRLFRATASLALLSFLISIVGNAQLTAKLPSAAIPSDHMQQYSDDAVQWMHDYLRINTSNPPGHELVAAQFFKKVLDAEGIENQLFEFTPGRANIWARIKGDGTKRPLILLSHEDVVTSDPAQWKADPFSADVIDGAMYGRGAQDMKEEGLAQLVVMVMLKREGVHLDRDVILLATADEEVDGIGTDWMIAHQRDLLENAEFLITEGGDNLLQNGHVESVGVDVAEKSPFWLKLTAHGTPGHASVPLVDSAPNRLVRALNRVINYQTKLKVLPVVEEHFKALAPTQKGELATKFRDIQGALKNKSFANQISADPEYAYLLRNTISLTRLQGSQQTNVIPGEAIAFLDVRLLPGEDAPAFLALMKKVVNDPNVTVEPENSDFRKANASAVNTSLFQIFRDVASSYWPGTPVVPTITSGYTENQRYREIGINCYGFSPYSATKEEGATEHGNNERVRIEELRRAPRILFDVVATLGTR
jgi:acetylornithine deacetylase/succinyl-diaminopimelate desuccinylase-like protein